MISGENIAVLIKEPQKTSVSNLTDLEGLIEKYPYCSSFYHLALKGAANSGSVEFEDKLKIAAAHVGDREHLYYLINNEEKINDPPLDPIATSETEVILGEKLEVSVVSEDEIEPSVLQETGEINIPKKNIEPINEIEDPEQSTSQSIIKKEVDEDSVSLETDILSHAIAVAFEHSAETAIPDKENEPTIEIGTSREIEPVQAAEEKYIEVEKTKNVVTESREELSFIEWLQVKKSGSKTPDLKQEQEASSKLNLEIKESSKSEINELLDKFISEEPSISRLTKEFYSPTANAKKSLEESGEIVSETLAKIHVMQGNYSKAIAAYKQLSLLYPEKNSFFATQIEKIKQKQTQ